MSEGWRSRRHEKRKYRRIYVRYGQTEPERRTIAQQLTSSGLFLATNDLVYKKDCKILIEITGPDATWIVQGIVRHSLKVHPSLAAFRKPGMGVELLNVPDACRAFLASE